MVLQSLGPKTCECYLTWQRAFAGMIKQRIMRQGDYPEFLCGPHRISNVTINVRYYKAALNTAEDPPKLRNVALEKWKKQGNRFSF
jgi:hypothetical protein